MPNVVNIADFRSKQKTPPPPRSGGRTRGLGVLIAAPGAEVTFGVLGGNVGVSLPTKLAFDGEFDVNRLGRDIREARGISLNLSDDEPEPPTPLLA